MTFMIKTLVDEHECHRVYNNKEAEIKWFTSMFENLVKSNSSVSVKVICDLLKENYRVSVDVQRLYMAKKIALMGFSYKGEHYKKLFWRATRSCNMFDFNEAMDEIRAIDPTAKSWLQKVDIQYWMVMKKFQERKKECETWNSVLPPRVNVKILKNDKESRLLTIIAIGNGDYELLDPIGGYGVKLRVYNCQCGYWQISGIPCNHAMAAISHYCGKSVLKDKATQKQLSSQQQSTNEESSS
ncbi:hypothetical protein Q3G72_001413 [Acer saccharum]|nr:hypothetical protein Q3G72_001413 [Acer saccharum]